jgi:hypothetical protein
VDGYNADTHLRIMCELNLIESEQGKLTVNIEMYFRVHEFTEYLIWLDDCKVFKKDLFTVQQPVT